jgi:hypothetical protein
MYMKNIFSFRMMALVILLAGAAGSLGFMFYAGHGQRSVVLIILFTVWVLSPFAGLLIADRSSGRWTVRSRVTLYWLIIVIALGSLMIYSGFLIPFGTKPAFKFLVVPFISWLLLLTVILAGRMAAKKT